MLLVTSASGKCVLLNPALCDERAVALIEQRLGKPVAELGVVAEDASPVTIGGVERIPETIADILGADRMEGLEYSAYDKVETLVSQAKPGRTRNCLLAGYHEVASFATRNMCRLAVMRAGRPPFLLLVDTHFIEGLGRRKGTLDGLHVEEMRTSSYWLRAAARIAHEGRFSRAQRRLVRACQKHGYGVVRLSFAYAVFLVRKRLEWIYFTLIKPVLVFAINAVYVSCKRLFQYFIARWQRLSNIMTIFRVSERYKPWRRMLQFKQNEMADQVGQSPRAEDIRHGHVVVMTVQDSGTRVNLDPALAIAREFRYRRVSIAVLTESRFVLREFAREGFVAVLVGYSNWYGGPLPASPLSGRPNEGEEPSLALALGRRYWRSIFNRLSETQYLMAKVESRIRIAGVLSINETLPISVGAGLWARARGRPWIGHFPILLGKRADCYYFPADQHLAYGEQLRDHMIGAGVVPGAIDVVGSFTYDKHSTRDRKADRLAVEANFPRAANAKLVTVATENLAECDIELVPVLNTVCAFPGAHVVLKLHPEDSLDYFERLADRLGVRAKIDIVKKYPLGELLCASDLLICVMSNIAIEAAVTGTPTLMCDFSGKAKVLDFAAEGLSMPCKSAGELAEMLRKLLTDESFMASAQERMRAGLRRFNGPNDGRSTQRIVDYVIAHAGLACGVEKTAARELPTSDGPPAAGESGASQDTLTMAR